MIAMIAARMMLGDRPVPSSGFVGGGAALVGVCLAS